MNSETGRSLSRMAPQIEEVVNRLRNELTRREAILASMTDGMLAVDARLNVTFCNRAFTKAVGDHGPAEGVPLIKIVRDPVLFQIVKQVVDSGVEQRKRLQLSTPECSRSMFMPFRWRARPRAAP